MACSAASLLCCTRRGSGRALGASRRSAIRLQGVVGLGGERRNGLDLVAFVARAVDVVRRARQLLAEPRHLGIEPARIGGEQRTYALQIVGSAGRIGVVAAVDV